MNLPAASLSTCQPACLPHKTLPDVLHAPGSSAAGEGGREPPGGGLPPRGPGYPPIGMASAQQSAAQVSSLLGGTPASDRRIQDMLNDLLASKSRAELWEVMRMLKNFLGGDKEAAKQFFAERPGLTKAVFQTQVLLGEWCAAAWCDTNTDSRGCADVSVAATSAGLQVWHGFADCQRLAGTHQHSSNHDGVGWRACWLAHATACTAEGPSNKCSRDKASSSSTTCWGGGCAGHTRGCIAAAALSKHSPFPQAIVAGSQQETAGGVWDAADRCLQLQCPAVVPAHSEFQCHAQAAASRACRKVVALASTVGAQAHTPGSRVGTFQGMHAVRTHEGFATVPGLDWQEGCMAEGYRGTQGLLPLNLRASNRLSCPTSCSSC